MIQLPRYKLVLDSTYLKVNGSYFSRSYYPTSLFAKYIFYNFLQFSTISYIDTSQQDPKRKWEKSTVAIRYN